MFQLKIIFLRSLQDHSFAWIVEFETPHKYKILTNPIVDRNQAKTITCAKQIYVHAGKLLHILF